MAFYTARYDAGFKNAIGCESQKDLLKYFLEKTLIYYMMMSMIRNMFMKE